MTIFGPLLLKDARVEQLAGTWANEATGNESIGYTQTGITPTTQKAIFGFGRTTSNVSMTNLVSNTGVVGNDITGVGTARSALAAAGFSFSR